MAKFKVNNGHEVVDPSTGETLQEGSFVELDPVAERTITLVTNGYISKATDE